MLTDNQAMWAEMLDAMKRAQRGDGDGLGGYVTDHIKHHLLSCLSKKSAEWLLPCAERIGAAVERVSPVGLMPTRNGVCIEYGVMGLNSGDIFVAVANQRNHFGFGWTGLPDDDQVPDLSGFTGGDVWNEASSIVDAANGAKDKDTANQHMRSMIRLLFGQVKDALPSMRERVRGIREGGLPYALFIAVVARSSREEQRAAGGMIEMVLPVLTMGDELGGVQ